MRGDPEAIRRLVLNLVDNARKHTPQGVIRIAACARTDGDDPVVEITVEDTGEGIAPEMADRLGIACVLNAGTSGEKYVKGTGLGLAICKGNVAAHGGSMSIRSERGKGTRVTVSLRANLPEAAVGTELSLRKEIGS